VLGPPGRARCDNRRARRSSSRLLPPPQTGPTAMDATWLALRRYPRVILAEPAFASAERFARAFEVRPCCAMDRAVHSAASEPACGWPRDDRVHVQAGDIRHQHIEPRRTDLGGAERGGGCVHGHKLRQKRLAASRAKAGSLHQSGARAAQVFRSCCGGRCRQNASRGSAASRAGRACAAFRTFDNRGKRAGRFTHSSIRRRCRRRRRNSRCPMPRGSALVYKPIANVRRAARKGGRIEVDLVGACQDLARAGRVLRRSRGLSNDQNVFRGGRTQEGMSAGLPL